MSNPDSPNRQAQAAEYLACLSSLADELDRAMHAISENALSELEDSVATQHALSTRLHTLAGNLSAGLDDSATIATVPFNEDVVSHIYAATQALEHLNQCYAALLRHSSRCAGQMASVFRSFHGQEATGTGRKKLSCQV